MAKRTCSLPECSRPFVAKGLCTMHYQRQKKHGDPGITSSVRPGGICRIEGCGAPHVARGWCSKHYNRWQRDEGTGRPRCAVQACEKPALKRGWCDMHYGRWQKHGDPEKVIVKTRGVCAFSRCERLASAHGLCESHNRQRADGKPLVEIRAWRSQSDRNDAGQKLCRSCLGWLPEEEFGRSARHTDGLSAICRRCGTDKHRLANYGLTPEQYDLMLAGQAGGCAICGETCSSGRRLAVDHDHACCPDPAKSCGKCIRGLLCGSCNQGVGKFRDNPGRLRAAADYLERARG